MGMFVKIATRGEFYLFVSLYWGGLDLYVKTGKKTASCQQCVLQIWGELVMGRVSGGASWINISNVTGASCIDDISVLGEFAWGEFVLGRHVQSPFHHVITFSNYT